MQTVKAKAMNRDAGSELPAYLQATSAQGLISASQPVAQFEIGAYRNFVYLVIDWVSRVAAVVDPQADLKPIEDALFRHGLTLKAILLTHTHHDHIAGVPGLLEKYPELAVYCGKKDRHRLHGWEKQFRHFHIIEGDEKIPVGSIELLAMQTPGHSAGECCYFFASAEPPFLLTGDTLFIRDCGRTDFPDGSNEDMFHSLQRIKALPSETVILPGHHYKPECASTLAHEIKESAPLRARSVEELAALP